MLFSFVVTLFLAVSYSKVYELYTRDHFHDLLQDLPVGARYASVIAVYNDTNECKQALRSLHYNDHDLPSALYLLLTQYEMTTQHERVWHEYEDHLDLPKHLGINDYINSHENCQCPLLLYVPITYANEIGDDYMTNPSLNGLEFWDSNIESDWKKWLWSKMKVSFNVMTSKPYNFEITVIPHPSNPFNNAESLFKADAMQSHTTIEAYVGDEFFVSKNPRSTKQNHKRNKPTPLENPHYEITPDIGLINEFLLLEEDDEGRFGFNMGRRKDVESERFVKKRHSTTMMTHTRNLILPTVLPNHDTLGFKKLQMPPGLHERLVRYYKQHYHRRATESWDDVGTQLNFFDVKSFMISLDHDWRERDSIANDVIKPLLLEWSNEKELELTAFYGIREYETGAVLRNHVDRVDTHVYSVILQIGQTGIGNPWPLEVIGFDGKRYLITLKPGEMILYEGTKLIHGRPYPCNGTLFSNAFVHFKPPHYKWNTGKVWGTPGAKAIMNKLHMRLQDIYR